ncbi:MAG: AbrB/MazE/SpoVT family DNA-binding domain-containing protein, partial [Promethearchaeota archaeon]
MDQIYRKLQKIGGSLVVSLPKKWTENYELGAGSSIAIDVMNDGTLSISPKFTIKEEVDTEEIVLESNSFVVWELLKSSLAGQTKIVIASDKEINKSLRNDIRYFVNGLPNTEITEESKYRIVIQNFGYKKIPTKQLI